MKNQYGNGKLITMRSNYFLISITLITAAIIWFGYSIYQVQHIVEQGEIDASIERLTIDHDHKQDRIHNYYDLIKQDSTSSNPGAIKAFKLCDSIISMYRKTIKLVSDIEKVENIKSSKRLFDEISRLNEILDNIMSDRPGFHLNLTGYQLFEEYLLFTNESNRKLCRLRLMNDIDELADQRLHRMVAMCTTTCIIPG